VRRLLGRPLRHRRRPGRQRRRLDEPERSGATHAPAGVSRSVARFSSRCTPAVRPSSGGPDTPRAATFRWATAPPWHGAAGSTEGDVVSDIEAIRRLHHLYAYTFDSGDFDAFAA